MKIQIMFTLGGCKLAMNLFLLLFSLGSPAFGNLLWNKIACSVFQNRVHRWELDAKITIVQFVSFRQLVHVQCCVFF